MKALVYTNTEEMVYRDEPEPVASNDEAIVKIDAVGVCGSDMHAYHGHDSRRVPPLILGHEAAGEVQTGQHKGKRVVLNPLITCGQCDYCQLGRSNLCLNKELIGMRIAGAFAQYIAIPERNLLPIPQDMDMISASLTEPTATSLHAIVKAEKVLDRPVSEIRTVVIGGGAVGVLAALLLRDKGCREILIGDVNPLRREMISKLEGITVYDPLSDNLPAQGRFELVIDAVGSGRTREAASVFVKAGGVISHIGLQDNANGLDMRRITLEEITVLGNYTYSSIDLKASIDALYSGSFGALDWVEVRTLQEGANVFQDIAAGKTAASKVVLLPFDANSA